MALFDGERAGCGPVLAVNGRLEAHEVLVKQRGQLLGEKVVVAGILGQPPAPGAAVVEAEPGEGMVEVLLSWLSVSGISMGIRP